MNYKFILSLLLFGFLMGFAVVKGLLANIELMYWLFIYLVCALVLAKTCRQKYFLNGFVLGVCISIIASLIQILFFDEYLLNNSEVNTELNKLPSSSEPKTFFIMIAPIIGLISGLVLGVFTTAFRWLTKRTNLGKV